MWPPMRAVVSASAGLLALLTPGVGLAESFNLECSGKSYTMTKIMFGKPEKEWPFTRIYRVDLTAGRYCRDACTTTERLVGANQKYIVFVDDEDSAGDADTYVNREDGSYLERHRLMSGATFLATVSSGECRKAPFTGFPTPKF